MLRTILVRVIGIALVLGGGWAAYTQAPAPARPFNAEKVKDGLYLITGGGGNVAAYITGDGVILVDDMYERDYPGVVEQVHALTDQPIRYILNTHHHSDHAGGNAVAPQSIPIIAHSGALANFIRLGQPGPPQISFDHDVAVHLGGKEVRAYFFGRGHTGGDAVILFPELNVIHTGDLFLTRPALPYIDYDAGGSVIEWTQAIDGILKLDFDTIIPGHGPVSGRAGLLKWRADFVTMRNRIKSLVKGGASEATVERVLIEEFGWPEGGLAIQEVDQLVAELKSVQ